MSAPSESPRDPSLVWAEAEPHPRWGIALRLIFESAEAVNRLRGILKEVRSNGREIRWTPALRQEKWTVFWKQREASESRLLLAHPEAEEWVATAALTLEHLDSLDALFQEKTERPEPGMHVVSIDALGAVSSGGNMIIQFQFKLSNL